MANTNNIELTQGERKSFIINYVDAEGAALDLTDWQFRMDFKDRYNSLAVLFSLEWDEDITFVDDDPTLGQVKFVIPGEATEEVTINLYTGDDYDIPYNVLVGDIKAIPPTDYELEVEGSRPIVFVKVNAGVTA